MGSLAEEFIEPGRPHRGLANIHLLIRTRLWAQILAAMTLGVVAGLVFSPAGGSPLAISDGAADAAGDWLRLPGSLFLNLIQMVVIPLIATSIILGVTSTGDPAFLRKVSFRIVPYFVATTCIAVTIGATLAYWLEPGAFIDPSGFDLQAEQSEIAASMTAPQDRPGLAAQIADLIPANPSQATLYRNMLQIVVAALIIGVAIAALGDKRMAPLLQLLKLIQEVALKIVGWAMLLAPLAVFGLIADFVLRAGFSALAGMSVYILAVVLGLVILLGVYLVIVALVGGRSPLRFLGQVADAQLLAFSTSSSAATMPLSMAIAENRLRVDPAIAKFIIPFGATVNMDGTALYQVVAALFVAQMFGVSLDPPTLLVLMATVVGASIGSPSTPGVGIVILATILQSIGIPPAGAAIILGVDRILDMCRTAVNVTGDLAACVVMNKWLAPALEARDPGPKPLKPEHGV